jgi:hypothetical protein
MCWPLPEAYTKGMHGAGLQPNSIVTCSSTPTHLIVLQILFQHAARTNPIAYQLLIATVTRSQLKASA